MSNVGLLNTYVTCNITCNMQNSLHGMKLTILCHRPLAKNDATLGGVCSSVLDTNPHGVGGGGGGPGGGGGGAKNFPFWGGIFEFPISF